VDTRRPKLLPSQKLQVERVLALGRVSDNRAMGLRWCFALYGGGVMSQNPLVEIRPIGLDSLAELRHIHALAFRSYLSSDLSNDQIDALVDFVRTREYMEMIFQTACLGAWIDQRLCATGSWTPGGAVSSSARLIGICVDPLFAGLGLARRLVTEVEAQARRAGFSTMTARSPVTMAPFFERLGYSGTSRGAWMTPCGVSIPVLHMRKGEERKLHAEVPRVPPLGRVLGQGAPTRLH